MYLSLIYEFLNIGLFSVGGGLATLPFLYSLTEKYNWFTQSVLMDMIAISESTPGPIGLNMATYAGFSAGGVAGGVLASLSLIVPSFVIMTFVVKVLDKFKENRFVKAAFYGIRPAVTALIASAAIGIVCVSLFGAANWAEVLKIPAQNIETFFFKKLPLFAALLYLMKYDRHPVFYIAGAAIAGAVFSF